MLESIRTALRLIDSSPLHPQWIVNRHHKKNKKKFLNVSDSLVLEIGCGSGDISKYLGGGNFLIRSDFPDTSVRYGNPPSVFLDAQSLPIRSDSVDAVVMMEVLEHVPNSELVFSEITRVLKKEGRLYMSVPFIYPLHDEPFDFYRFSPYGLDVLLRKFNFSVIERSNYPEGVECVVLLANYCALKYAKKLDDRIGLASLPFMLLIYIFCIFGNLIACFFRCILPSIRELYMGQFLIARADKD